MTTSVPDVKKKHERKKKKKKKTKPWSVSLSFLFDIKFIDSRSGLVRKQPFNLSLLCRLRGFAHRQRWLVGVKAALPPLVPGRKASSRALCPSPGLDVAALIYNLSLNLSGMGIRAAA